MYCPVEVITIYSRIQIYKNYSNMYLKFISPKLEGQGRCILKLWLEKKYKFVLSIIS